MINYELPTTICISGIEYPINKKGDYRMVLDVISALNDKELTEQERAYAALSIFYDFNIPEDTQAAADEMMKFINCGEEERSEQTKESPIMSWDKDFPLLVAPINKGLGFEIRLVKYLHWWTFISAYLEIGECQFQTVVNIRQKKRKGKPLDKWEQEYYRKNRNKVDLDSAFTNEEEEYINNILGL